VLRSPKLRLLQGYFLSCLVFLSDPVLSNGPPIDFRVSLDHVTIAVKNLDRAAKIFSRNGFTLKKPHEYKSGPQKGLVSQAVRFKSGQYLQLIAVEKEAGALSKWYQKKLKAGEGGATVILKHSHPDKLCDLFQKNDLPCQSQNKNFHQWLSFKTNGPYHPIAFIKYDRPIKTIDELLNHKNKVVAIKRVSVSPQGDPFQWAKIMTLAQAQGVGLEFSSTGHNSSGVFINEIKFLTESNEKRAPFFLGKTAFRFQKTDQSK
jgi:hypothetical protein